MNKLTWTLANLAGKMDLGKLSLSKQFARSICWTSWSSAFDFCHCVCVVCRIQIFLLPWLMNSLFLWLQKIYWCQKTLSRLLILVLHGKYAQGHLIQNMSPPVGKVLCLFFEYFAPYYWICGISLRYLNQGCCARYRAPEVLLQSPTYTSAVGRWSDSVKWIILSLCMT